MKYKVTVDYTTCGSLTVEAKDEDDARGQVEELLRTDAGQRAMIQLMEPNLFGGLEVSLVEPAEAEVVTKEREETYRMVRRFYAEQDVREWLKDHDIDPDGCDELEELTDRYDEWQGDNPHWYEAIGIFADDMGLEA